MPRSLLSSSLAPSVFLICKVRSPGTKKRDCHLGLTTTTTKNQHVQCVYIRVRKQTVCIVALYAETIWKYSMGWEMRGNIRKANNTSLCHIFSLTHTSAPDPPQLCTMLSFPAFAKSTFVSPRGS